MSLHSNFVTASTPVSEMSPCSKYSIAGDGVERITDQWGWTESALSTFGEVSGSKQEVGGRCGAFAVGSVKFSAMNTKEWVTGNMRKFPSIPQNTLEGAPPFPWQGIHLKIKTLLQGYKRLTCISWQRTTQKNNCLNREKKTITNRAKSRRWLSLQPSF